MSKIIPIIILFYLNNISVSYSQRSSDSTDNFIGDIATLDILYGTYFYNQDFNKQLNTFNHSKVLKPLQTFGLSLSVIYSQGNRYDFGVHSSYSQIIPQKINVNDTIEGIINGFNFSYSIYGINLTPKSKFSSIILGVGINTGRLRIKSDIYKSQKNPFFAPVLSFNPKFYLGKIVLGFRTEYQFDVSKKGWRSVNFTNREKSFPVLKFNQSGLITYFSIGWKL